MNPDMSVSEMLDSFIFIVKGSRVIDCNERDWKLVAWRYGHKLVERSMVYSAADMKRYFAHRVFKSKWKSDRRDPFGDWLKNRFKLTAPTLHDAIELADQIARGQVEMPSAVQARTLREEAEAKVASLIVKDAPDWMVRQVQQQV